MNLYAIFALVNLLVGLGLCLVILSGKAGRPGRTAVLLSLGAAVWNAGYFLWQLRFLAGPGGISAYLALIFIILAAAWGFLLARRSGSEAGQDRQLESLARELEGANEKLKALDQARTEFLSIANHQLRTPPATIKWYLSAILAGDYGKVPAKLAPELEKAQQANDHLMSLIEDMLDVSQIERGKMEFLFEPVSVESLASPAVQQLLPIAASKGLQLTYRPPDHPLPQIMADKAKLREVMNNLIDNAIKYTKAGAIDVSLFEQDGSITFRVKDTGKGIAPDEQNSIFEKFRRGKDSAKQSAGLGLGLYVAKIVVEQHKGKIWAESTGENQGATFCFTLPVHSGLKATTMVDLGRA
ncbi:MAG TPA: HAMP domain-containing sensor histidine kinase [Patescibacteria group bacterium]|nr:HAMP domain-containing sensor histidine kinase [Patescibacteria group bacterium]